MKYPLGLFGNGGRGTKCLRYEGRLDEANGINNLGCSPSCTRPDILLGKIEMQEKNRDEHC